MRLFIEGLEKKDGYFEMPFEAYGILGEERDKLIVIGDNLSANFELAKTVERKPENAKYIIYQTPENFPYNTLGYIAKLSCWNIGEGINTFFYLKDFDKIEVLSVNIELSEKSESAVRTLILKISLENENDSVDFVEINYFTREEKVYHFTNTGVEVSEVENLKLHECERINNLSFLKIDKEFEKVAGIMD